MARYDRIAPLDPPPRARAIPGWYVFLDLEDDDRDEDLASRARLRFLALRPLHRILRHGLERVNGDSIRAGLDKLTEELGHLPARDPERAVLRDLIASVSTLEPGGVCEAAFRLSEEALRRGHLHGAEEAARTGTELAEACRLSGAASRGHTLLASVLRRSDRLEEAAAAADEAVGRSGSGAPGPWMLALRERMVVLRLRGDQADADRDLETLSAAAAQTGDDALRQHIATVVCEELLDRGEPERAAELAWSVLVNTPDDAMDPDLLCELCVALRRLGMYEAAEHAYVALEWLARDGEARVAALAEHALMAACRKDDEEFRHRRDRLTSADPTGGLIANHLEAQLALGRGCVLVGDDACAETHLGIALDLAELADNASAAELARDLKRRLHQRGSAPPYAEPLTARPGDSARRVARGLAERTRAV